MPFGKFGFPQTQRVCEITLQHTFHRHPVFNSSRAVQELSQTIQDLWRSTFNVSAAKGLIHIHTRCESGLLPLNSWPIIGVYIISYTVKGHQRAWP